jgi:acetyl esterase/lipase
MKPLITLILIPFLSQFSPSTAPQLDTREQILLWPAVSTTQPATAERESTGRFYNVSVPMMFVWAAPADKANGTAIIVCPGGSYDHVTMEMEGQRIATLLNPLGVTVFGLKYRTSPPSTDVAADALADGQRAMRVVRNNAAAWKINPNRIGMMGYSAGSNLVLNVMSHFDSGGSGSDDPIQRQSCRPDFVVLLSTWPNRQTTLDSFPLNAQSPPAFMAIAQDDRTAPPAFTALIKSKLDELKVPIKLHEVPTGGHGAFHIGERNVDTTWVPSFIEWMKANKWIS